VYRKLENIRVKNIS